MSTKRRVLSWSDTTLPGVQSAHTKVDGKEVTFVAIDVRKSFGLWEGITREARRLLRALMYCENWRYPITDEEVSTVDGKLVVMASVDGHVEPWLHTEGGVVQKSGAFAPRPWNAE